MTHSDAMNIYRRSLGVFREAVRSMFIKTRTKCEMGQAMVETAIVLPLFIFMVLGTIQMTLIFQARSLTKYAAYRAARAGAMNQMDPKKMKKAAFLALAPVMTGCFGCSSSYPPTSASKLMMASFMSANMNMYLKGFLPVVEIRTCGPLKTWFSASRGVNGLTNDGTEVDFDDPRNTYDATSVRALTNSRGITGDSNRNFERTRLRIQVEYNHRLIIPFANWIFYNIWKGKELAEHLRLSQKRWPFSMPSFSFDKYDMAKAMGTIVMPLHANYAFRMQSNFNTDVLPENNECISYANPRS